MQKYLKITIFLLIGITQTIASQGLEVYQVKNIYPNFSQDVECHYCSTPKKEDLFDTPLISEKNIVKFNWETQKIELTEDAQNKINELEIPLQGLPVAFTINREIIYVFWFWNEISSFGCDRIYTYPKLDFKIKFGLPSSFKFGNDERFDQKLKTYLNKKN